jgi:hypothetical protein
MAVQNAQLTRFATGKLRGNGAPLLLAAGFALVLGLNWPGQMSYDSVLQLADGRSGHYDTWHPPVMAWLLGLFDGVLPGPGLYLAFTMLLLAAAWFTLLAIGRPKGRALLLIAAIFATPQLLLYQGTIWKDVLFADAAVMGFAALAAAAGYWQTPRPRLLWLSLSALCLALAALARQNGFLLLPVAALALAGIAGRKQRRRPALLYGVGFLAVSVLLWVAGSFLLSFNGDGGAGARAQLSLAETYDLTGAARLDPKLRFPLLEQKAPMLATSIRAQGIALYSPHLVDTLETSPQLMAAMGHAPQGVIFAAWRGLIAGHPGLYLRERWPVFGWLMAPADPLLCHPDVVGVDGPRDVMQGLGLAPRIRAQERFLYSYVARFIGTPVLSHLTFLALALLLMGLLLRRGSPPDVAVAGLLAAAMIFTASFFVISIACDYRYLYFLDLAALTGALQWAGGGPVPREPF